MKKFRLLHQENEISPFTIEILRRGFHGGLLAKFLRNPFKDTLIVFHKCTLNWYGDWDNWTDLGDEVLEKVKEDSKFCEKVLGTVKEVGEKLYQKNQETLKLDLSKLSNQEIAKIIDETYQLGEEISDYGQIAVFSDLTHNKLSNLLNEILQKKNLKRSLNEYFSILVAPTERVHSQQERIEVFKLAKKIKELGLFKDGKLEIEPVSGELAKIKEDFCWVGFGHFGPEKKIENYLEDLKIILEEGKVEEKLAELFNESKELAKQQAEYTGELDLDELEQRYFAAARSFGYNKNYRYHILLFTFYALNELLKEVCKRFILTIKEIRFMSREEVLKLLEIGEKVPSGDLRERQKFCVIKTAKTEFLLGQEAKDYVAEKVEKEEVDEEVTRIHGSVAYMGIVTGKVKIVNSVRDIGKVSEGDILVSVQTNPDLLPAMKKAAAIVTDTGGITCHAAIVAREIKTPTLIGTKIATKVFKDGDMVEVDADKGVVRKI
jgi:phosphoenolpyruvate synthase/pyruvate phosphate dikinase